MLIALTLGLVVGLILVLTGAGGGILAVPLLVFVTQMEVAQAGPIGMLAVGMTAALGALLGLRDGIVRCRAALLIAVAGMLLSPAGLWLAHRIDNRLLTILFAVVLLLDAVRTWRQAQHAPDPALPSSPIQYSCQRSAETERITWTGGCVRTLTLSGAFTRLLSGLLGVGGGFVIVPALQRHTNMTMDSVVATSLAIIALVSVTGVAASAATLGIVWPVALPFSPGALIGMLGGRLVSARLAGTHLEIGFAIITATVAVGMLVKSSL